jgi:hypothetical protein
MEMNHVSVHSWLKCLQRVPGDTVGSEENLQNKGGSSDGLSRTEAIAVGCSVGGVALLATFFIWYLFFGRKTSCLKRGSDPATKPAPSAVQPKV